MGYVSEVKPEGFKAVNDLELLRRVKQVSPNTKTIWRKHVNDQGPYYQGDPIEGAARFFNWMYDELAHYGDVIDYVEGINEEIGTGCRDKNRQVVAFEAELADLVGESGLAKPCVLNVAVGNPGHDEVADLIPAVEAAVRWDGLVGYHAYWPTTQEQSWLVSDWKHYAGRWTEWDRVFNDHDLYPCYAFTEGGPISGPNPPTQLGAGSGWRSPECLNGDWGRHMAQLGLFRLMVRDWNAEHGNRARFLCLFTVGRGMDWEYFEYHQEELAALKEELR